MKNQIKGARMRNEKQRKLTQTQRIMWGELWDQKDQLDTLVDKFNIQDPPEQGPQPLAANPLSAVEAPEATFTNPPTTTTSLTRTAQTSQTLPMRSAHSALAGHEELKWQAKHVMETPLVPEHL